MNIELLPNETLLDIFHYLTGVSLLQGFYGLNTRFNFLLYNHFRLYRFDFSSCSKHQFDMICQQHLPFIADRVTILTLSAFNNTPGQIDHFFSYIPSISPFIHLKTLELSNIPSYSILIKIVDELHYLRNLHRLVLRFRSHPNYRVNLQLIIDNIWSLPKLNYCHFDVAVDTEQLFCLPTKLSTSLQYVDISRLDIKWSEIYRLYQYTPRLKCLHINIASSVDVDDYKSTIIPTLIDLNITISNQPHVVKVISFLENVPNLRRLNVRLLYSITDGYQWEKTIRHFLPKLKVFKLAMSAELSNGQNIEERVNELINSFQSSFWIDEQKWFVRCFTHEKTIHLRTLSKIYYNLKNDFPVLRKSTYPDDDPQKFYNTMQGIYSSKVLERPVPSYFCLHNIHFLSIKLPIDEQFWTIVPNLNRLTRLIVSFDTDKDQSQLQYLLDRASHLRDLSISQDKPLSAQMSLFKYTNTSIRELDLQQFNHDFNEEESIALSRSPLGVQCEVLSVKVKHRQSIIILIQNMIKLQALRIESRDDEYSKHLSLTDILNESNQASIANKDELIQWLKDNLSSTYFISRDFNSGNRIQIWIQ